jgi:hypothetical protein
MRMYASVCHRRRKVHPQSTGKFRRPEIETDRFLFRVYLFIYLFIFTGRASFEFYYSIIQPTLINYSLFVTEDLLSCLPKLGVQNWFLRYQGAAFIFDCYLHELF